MPMLTKKKRDGQPDADDADAAEQLEEPDDRGDERDGEHDAEEAVGRLRCRNPIRTRRARRSRAAAQDVVLVGPCPAAALTCGIA
jgi:hypothetical protein